MLATAQSVANLPKSITLSYQSTLPGSQSVKPLATIFYNPDNLKTSLTSWTPPTFDSSKSTTAEPTSLHVLRILLPSGSSILTSLGTFNSSLTQHIDLHLAGDGAVFSASVYASTPIVEVLPSGSKSKSKAKKQAEAQKKAQANANVQIKIIESTPGPAPKLASKKPPVVGVDGKEVVVEEGEKSFFQKYWWVFAIVGVVAMAGGGDK